MLLSNEGSASGLLLLKSIYTEDYSTNHPTPSLDLVQNHQRPAASLLLERSLLAEQLKLAHASPFSASSYSASAILSPTASIPVSDASSLRPAHPYTQAREAIARQKTAASAHFDASPMSGSYFPFEPSSLPHPSRQPNTFSDPPTMNEQPSFQKSGAISPGAPFATHQHQWINDGQSEQDVRLQSPAQPAYQPPYSLPKDSSHQTSPVALHNHGHDNSSSHYLHRASISGPVMDSLSYHSGHQEQMAAPAPPRVHGLAAWENASGSARPHTADGLFGHFGFAPSGHSHDGSVEGTTAPSLGPTSRPYTPAGPSASVDPYFQQRRFSLPDPDAVGTPGSAHKIFSYMPPMDDGVMPGSSSMTMGATGYSGHYFGNMNGFHSGSSKKRPRRRYDEIERLYACSWSGCNKSYGTLNHLNAHVAMQKHGPKRAPTEFKDMRKAWRKQKKDEEQRRQGRHGPLMDTGSGRSDLTRPGTSSAYVHSITAGATDLASAAVVRPPNLGEFGSSVAPASSGIADLGHHSNFGAELSKYSMSSVAESPVPSSQPFLFHGSFPQQQQQQQPYSGSNTSSVVSSVHGPELSEFAVAVPDSRHNTATNPGVMGAQLYQHPNFAGYLAAHRGSI